MTISQLAKRIAGTTVKASTVATSLDENAVNKGERL